MLFVFPSNFFIEALVEVWEKAEDLNSGRSVVDTAIIALTSAEC